VYAVYSLVLFLAVLVTSPWWLLEMLRHGKYRADWRERLGTVPDRLFQQVSPDTIWIHAVSVGEVLAMSRVIGELKARLPGWRVVVSTTTDTGQKLARERFGAQDVFYLPLDLPFAVRAYLQALQPKMVVLAESEFWPNLLLWSRRSGAAVAVVNARVSDRSLPGYRRFRLLLRRVLNNVQLFLAQSQEDARRLIEIGAPGERVHVSGNLKFEVRPPAVSPLLTQLQPAVQREEIGPAIIAGSTLQGEEAMLLDAFRLVVSKYPGALLVLAPRHPERFPEVAALLASSGLRVQKRSEWDGQRGIAGGVFLLDSIGELASLYQLADLAFIGGSLVPRGGHNVLEAALYGVPIVVGPYTENFRDIVEVFRLANALCVVTPQAFAATVLRLLEDYPTREAVGRRALEIMNAQQGATERTVTALLALLPQSQVELAAAGSPGSRA
jgi:3-deoxy-D-manno-octulosonic-acid transferase